MNLSVIYDKTNETERACLIKYLRRDLETLYMPAELDKITGDFIETAEKERDRLPSRIMGKFMYSTVSHLPIRLFAQEHFDMPCPLDKRNIGVTDSGSMKKCPVGVIFLDIEGFKGINDHLSYAHGDMLLRALGKWLQEWINAKLQYMNAIVVHYGGDEFAVYIIHGTLPCQAAHNKGETGDLITIKNMMGEIKINMEQQTLLLVMNPDSEGLVESDVRFLPYTEKGTEEEDGGETGRRLRYYFNGISMAYGVGEDFSDAMDEYAQNKESQKRDPRVRGALMFGFCWKGAEYISLLSNHIFVVEPSGKPPGYDAEAAAKEYSSMILDAWKEHTAAIITRYMKIFNINLSYGEYIGQKTPAQDYWAHDGYLLFRIDMSEWTNPELLKKLPLLFTGADEKDMVERGIIETVRERIKSKARKTGLSVTDRIMPLGLK